MADIDGKLDRDAFRREVLEELYGVSRELAVTFAARCVWRVWPMVVGAEPEWLEEHSSGVTAGLVIATLKGAAWSQGEPDEEVSRAAAAAVDDATATRAYAYDEASADAYSVAVAVASAVRASAYADADADAASAVSASVSASASASASLSRRTMILTIREDLRLVRDTSLIEVPLWHAAQAPLELSRSLGLFLREAEHHKFKDIQQTARWYRAMEAGKPPLDEMAAWLEEWWQKHPDNKEKTSAFVSKQADEPPAPKRSKAAAKAKSSLRKLPDDQAPAPPPVNVATAPAADPETEPQALEALALAGAGMTESGPQDATADPIPADAERTPPTSVPNEAEAPAAGESSTAAPFMRSRPRMPFGSDDTDPSPFNDDYLDAPDPPTEAKPAPTAFTAPEPEPAPEPPLPPERLVRRVKNLRSTTAIVPDGEADELTKTAKECMLALRAFLVSPDTKAPLTVSVEAPWGGGKSSLLRHLQTTLEADGIPTVWFNPWKHEAGKTLWAAFALSFERQMASRCGWWRRKTRRVGLAWKRLEGVEKVQLVIRLIFWLAAIAWLVALAWSQTHVAETTKWKEWVLLQAPWLGVFVMAYGLIADAVKQLGSPLKVDVTRLLTHNDHQDKVDDLHRFHEDFRRLLEAYVPPAKPAKGPPGKDARPAVEGGRVVVFIDDLDRCEAPKAADLLQSLHQMLNVTEDRPAPAARKTPAGSNESSKDSAKSKHTRQPPGVMCILGMDRDKVAAAVAAKHEKLLPYLEGADDKGHVPRQQAMDFGHEYLEKFIQLTLHLPGMHGDDRDGYLRAITGWTGKDEPVARPVPAAVPTPPPSPAAPPPAPGSMSAPAPGSSGEAEPLAGPEGDESPGTPPVATPSGGESPAGPGEPDPLLFFEPVDEAATTAAVQERLRIVDEDLSDGHIAHRCALAAADALENNPRKLKQFVNLFRLRLYLCAALDVLDKNTLLPETTTVAPNRLSAQHVAKLVALDLACPQKMSTARDHPERGLLDQVLDCAQGNPAVRALIGKDSTLGPMHDLKHAPLKLYFQNFLAGGGER